MKTFKAGNIKDPEVRALAVSIEQAAVRAEPYAELQPLAAPPSRPRRGMFAFADGTNWDPGSGEGVYVFKSDLAWHFLG